MLEIRDLKKSYYLKKQQISVLKNINLKFNDYGFVVIIGKSGSGKSTLLNILGGLDSYDYGEIIIKGKSAKDFNNHDYDNYRNTYVGFVFQEFYLIEEFTIGKNISLALELQGVKKSDIENKVLEILEKVGLKDYKNRKVYELSGGQKQRIAIARALVKDPEIIIADEPTGNLDSETGKEILNILKEISKDKLVIMVTHDTDFAHTYADRIVELKDGIVVNDYKNELGNNEEIFKVDDKVKTVIKLPKGKELSNSLISHINQHLKNDKVYLSLTSNANYLNSFNLQKQEFNKIEYRENKEVSEYNFKNPKLPLSNAFKLAVHSIFNKKFRLTLTLLLFIASLVFMGIATNLAFYNSSEASYITLNKLNIKKIPIFKQQYACYPEGCKYVGWEDSFNNQDINDLRNKYNNISFIKIIDKNIDLSNVFYQREFDKEHTYYTTRFYDFVLIDEYKSSYSLKYGNYPNHNEIAITDYMADVLIYNKTLNNINIQADLVGQTFIHNEQTITISGIIHTDYNKYDDLINTNNTYNDTFNYDLRNFYNLIFLTEETYDSVFYDNETKRSFFIDKAHIYGTAKIANDEYDSYLIGNLPVNDDEIVLTLSKFNKSFNVNKDINEINEYLNQTITFEIRFYELDSVYYTYKIVGIIDDSTFEDDDVMMLVTKNEIQKYYDYNNYNMTALAILGNNEKENQDFISSLDELHYKHDTKYSNQLYSINIVIKDNIKAFYIIGGVFTLFSVLLIYTFMSIGISNKQKEIGTLRAIGASGKDVGKIFIIESILIGVITSIVSLIITNIITNMLNKSFIESFHLDITLIYMNVLTVILVFVVTILIVLLSVIIPIIKIIKMKPINAIKSL